MTPLGATPRAPRNVAGGRALEARVERYVLAPGVCHVLAMEAGEEWELAAVDGVCEPRVAAFRAGGGCGLECAGLRPGAGSGDLAAVLGGAGEDAQRARAGLARRGLDAKAARTGRVDLAGCGGVFRARAGEFLYLAVWLPAARMAVWDQEPPGWALLHVRRLEERSGGAVRLPEPLAEMRLDIRVPAAGAVCYEVGAGEYVQIIDAAGRQCSDFLAFDRRELDRGREAGLDAATSRTMNGAAFAQPGLAARYHDARGRPLVEVRQDTVGRHDTFNLACTRRYYEDLGYFGHANCSDNFNAALGPRGVTGRGGWPAINFFYNTNVDAANRIWFDEPWSRAGYFVLLRAADDLVCASSACPCDIDAANGWEPGEIQVRVYAARSVFRRSVGYRASADAPLRSTVETGFHPRTSELTRHYSANRGYWLPDCYTAGGAVAEYVACREAAAVMDLSALRKLEIVGPDAEDFLQGVFPRDIRKLDVQQIYYMPLCYEHGGMVDDGTLFRLGRDNFRWVGGDDAGLEWIRARAAAGDWRVSLREATGQIHNLAVQGPRSREILAQAVWTPPARPQVAELGFLRFTVGRLGSREGAPVLVSRSGYTGELGYEVFCHPDDGPAVWDAVMAAGEPLGLKPAGLAALDLLRIEAGLVASGREFDSTTDPFEAGIGFAVPAAKTEDFTGREALRRRGANPVRRLAGLRVRSAHPCGPGDPVFIGRAQVGVVTSAGRPPGAGGQIALARMDVSAAAAGTAVEVGRLDGLQKRLPAEVCVLPFHDPERKRLRS